MTTHSTTGGGDAEELADKREDLGYIVSELTKYRPEITDALLRDAVTEFLQLSRETPARSTREHVLSELAELRREWPMRREPKMVDGKDAFPDRCADCSHYGFACPVLKRNEAIQRREKILDDTSDPERLRQQLREYAIDYGCEVMLGALEDIQQDYEPLLERGQLLLALVEELVLYDDDSTAIKRRLAREKSSLSPNNFTIQNLSVLKEQGYRLSGDPEDPPLAPVTEDVPSTTADPDAEGDEAATAGGDD